jgi:acyl-coenzyme A synthetase/AMP-(fatty) acid ligase
MGTVGLPDGIEATISKEGHLLIHGFSVVNDNWIDTGDLAEQDSAGYYRILGRSVDQLNIKGKKFNPSSLESQLLRQFPQIKECVIFGVHELNCLYVGQGDAKEIQKFLFGLDSHLRLALLENVEEILLKYPGKISRSYLKALYNCQ